MITLNKFKKLIKSISEFSESMYILEEVGIDFSNSKIESNFYNLVDLILEDLCEDAQENFYDYVYSKVDSFGELSEEDIIEFYNILTNK